MKYLSNFSLKNHNTFGIDIKADKFISVSSVQQLKKVLQQNLDIFLLGGGSNILLTKDIPQTVVHLNLKGIIVNNKANNSVEVTAYAGENWHEFVLWCIEQNYGGLENLSLIPGNVGTCPIQNIGAYGFEVKDTILHLEALNKNTLEIHKFTNKECEFGYRNSVFKNQLKDKYVILSVTFQLTTQKHHTNTSYGVIQEELKKIPNPTIKNISNAIVAIRNRKLPNPKEIGNSGSFFKNPIISLEVFNKIKQQYPEVPSYPVSDTEIKIAAGWLIEKAGFKGKSFGNAGVHNQQALVLVNYGNATGKEIYKIATEIQAKIYSDFKINLEIEVNVF